LEEPRISHTAIPPFRPSSLSSPPWPPLRGKRNKLSPACDPVVFSLLPLFFPLDKPGSLFVRACFFSAPRTDDGCLFPSYPTRSFPLVLRVEIERSLPIAILLPPSLFSDRNILSRKTVDQNLTLPFLRSGYNLSSPSASSEDLSRTDAGPFHIKGSTRAQARIPPLPSLPLPFFLTRGILSSPPFWDQEVEHFPLLWFCSVELVGGSFLPYLEKKSSIWWVLLFLSRVQLREEGICFLLLLRVWSFHPEYEDTSVQQEGRWDNSRSLFFSGRIFFFTSLSLRGRLLMSVERPAFVLLFSREDTRSPLLQKAASPSFPRNGLSLLHESPLGRELKCRSFAPSS